MNPARRFARAHRNIWRRKIRYSSSKIHKNQLIRNIRQAMIQHSRNKQKRTWQKRLFLCYYLHRRRVIEGGSTPSLEYRGSLSNSLGWVLLCSPAPFIFRNKEDIHVQTFFSLAGINACVFPAAGHLADGWFHSGDVSYIR